jgi:NTP pyrophosphatase (non-canonical NTP hydrolase)
VDFRYSVPAVTIQRQEEKMNPANYREEVKRTAERSLYSILFGALGLAGETGEVVEIVKKYYFHGKPLDTNHLVEELGDVRWYLECLCIAANVSMEEVERRNVEKLRKRYPNGFVKGDK